MKAKYCKAKATKSNGEQIDEKDQCWVGDDKFQITSSPSPNGIQTVKNSDFGLLQNPVYESKDGYLDMTFYFTTDGTNRYERYFKSLDDYFRLEVYRHNHEEERHHRIDQAHIDQIKEKWPRAKMVVRAPEEVKGPVYELSGPSWSMHQCDRLKAVVQKCRNRCKAKIENYHL